MIPRWFASAVLVPTILASAGAASADMGPKPTLSFAFTFDRKDVSIAEGTLFMCGSEACDDPSPLKRVGPQGFDCGPQACGAMAYGFAPFGQLEITLSDGRHLRSNAFSTRVFNAKFRVVVGRSELTVRPVR